MDITSTKNDRVKLVRALQTQSKARQDEGLMVLEGTRLIQDALDCALAPEFVFYIGGQETLSRPTYRTFRRLMELNVPCLGVSNDVMEYATDLETHQGMLAVCRVPDLPIPASPTLVLIVDQFRNPGNLGSILRTAAAARVDLVVLSPETVDPYNPKVLRGGMGAHFRLPIVQAEWAEIALDYGQLNTYLADAGGATPYYAVDWLRPSAIIIGGEAHGPGSDARQVSGTSIHIPMANDTESLNAAVAAGVILYEVQRQRILSAHQETRP